MNRAHWLAVGLGLTLVGLAGGQDDPGKDRIGTICVTVYHASDKTLKGAGTKGTVAKETAERLRKEQRLRYKNYRLLGQDTQPLLRSYESWAEPLKPSDEVLVRFEAQGSPTTDSVVLDLELWLGRKKIVKTDALLEGKRPLFVRGPEWRGGWLIIGVALAPNPDAGLR